MDKEKKTELYRTTIRAIKLLIEDECDRIAVMATIACELHHAFDYFDWTGFYRVVAPGVLKIGPYQGAHGCLVIPFERGICGAAARSGRIQCVADIRKRQDHIACASSTLSEIVVPVFDTKGAVIAVLDIDSNQLAAFDEIDQNNLAQVCSFVGATV